MGKLRDKLGNFSLAELVDIKALILMFVGFFLLTCIIVFLIVFISLRNRNIAQENLAEQSAFVNSLNLSQETLRVGDFIMPEQINTRQTSPYLQREPKRVWEQSEIDKYWIDLRDTGVGEISKHNHDLIESLLQEVP